VLKLAALIWSRAAKRVAALVADGAVQSVLAGAAADAGPWARAA
jgi:hypothetical protein